jgi:hypothetical protein
VLAEGHPSLEQVEENASSRTSWPAPLTFRRWSRCPRTTRCEVAPTWCTPPIAGRTRDANGRVADVIADDFARILRGEAPHASLTPEAMRVRMEAVSVPGA